MIRILITIVLILPLAYAKKQLSPLPLPTQEVINLEPTPCDATCLQSLLEEGKSFSLLARYAATNDMPDMDYQVSVLRNQMRITFIPNDSSLEKAMQMRLAVIMPKKIIGRYALSTSRSILSYLLTRGRNFEVEIFDTGDEAIPSLESAIRSIKEKGYGNVLALLTSQGASNLATFCHSLNVFIPTINQIETQRKNPNIVLGGIDYKAQLETLMYYANDSLSVFYDDSKVGQNLNQYVSESQKEIAMMSPVKSTEKYAFQNLIKRNKKRISESSVVLNTPIIKSSLLMSQLTYYKVEPHAILSTQINYSPTLLTLTQERDRDNMFIANSISNSNDILDENNQLLGSNIRYDWINYASSIGTEYFFAQNFPSSSRYFEEKIVDNQVEYNINIIMPVDDQFMTVGE